jgi:hypothetical protein
VAAGEGTDPYYYADNSSNNISSMADAAVEDGIAIADCYGVQENDAGDGVDCVRSSSNKHYSSCYCYCYCY